MAISQLSLSRTRHVRLATPTTSGSGNPANIECAIAEIERIRQFLWPARHHRHSLAVGSYSDTVRSLLLSVVKDSSSDGSVDIFTSTPCGGDQSFIRLDLVKSTVPAESGKDRINFDAT